MCEVIIEATRVVRSVQSIGPEAVGKIDVRHCYRVEGTIVVLYFPAEVCPIGTSYEEASAKNALLFIEELANPKEVSHRLLLKKLQKCKTVLEIEEETFYFMTVYAIKKTPQQPFPKGQAESTGKKANSKLLLLTQTTSEKEKEKEKERGEWGRGNQTGMERVNLLGMSHRKLFKLSESS